MGKFVDSPGFRKFIQGDAVINMINGKLTRFKHALEKYGGVIDDATTEHSGGFSLFGRA